MYVWTAPLSNLGISGNKSTDRSFFQNQETADKFLRKTFPCEEF